MKKLFLKDGVLFVVVSELGDSILDKMFVETLGEKGIRNKVGIEDQYIAPVGLTKKSGLYLPSVGFEELIGSHSVVYQVKEDLETNYTKNLEV